MKRERGSKPDPPKRAVCDCGREHERFEVEGARVMGCPVCLRKPESADALAALIEAGKRMVFLDSDPPTPEGESP